EPSNLITVTVRPAPMNLTVDNKGGLLKQGQKLEVEVTIARQNGFAGPVTLALNAPGSFRLSSAPVTASKDQAKAKLVLEASRDRHDGAAAGVYVRATAQVRSENIEVDEPAALTIAK